MFFGVEPEKKYKKIILIVRIQDKTKQENLNNFFPAFSTRRIMFNF